MEATDSSELLAWSSLPRLSQGHASRIRPEPDCVGAAAKMRTEPPERPALVVEA